MNEQEKLKEALLKKALGFAAQEVVEEFLPDENGNPVLSKRKVTKKINPPDINALKFLLEQAELSDEILESMKDEELLAEKQRLLQLLKDKENEDENENV